VLFPGPSKGPDIMDFKWQKISWEFIDRSTCDIPVETLHSAVSCIASQVIDFVQIHLEQLQLLDEYRKLWELTITFLGGVPSIGISFRAPAELHRSRWKVSRF